MEANLENREIIGFPNASTVHKILFLIKPVMFEFQKLDFETLQNAIAIHGRLAR